MMSDPYPEYACDINQDGILNILDVIVVVINGFRFVYESVDIIYSIYSHLYSILVI